ncbi:MAG: hypothetical protein GX855_09545 [Firmicutes bacterium]|nr:hypothetical protein [Bacillota bacterium]
MTHRERYLETLLFGNPDRIPLQPGSPRESTLRTWHEQGLPEGVDYFEFLLDILGIDSSASGQMVSPGVSFKMIREFEEKILEHKDGHYIVQDWMGAITEISDEYDYTYLRVAKDFVTRKWHKFPVETRADWDEMKRRYDPKSPGRYPDNFDDFCQSLGKNGEVVHLAVNGPFWQLREWLGLESLCIFMITDPEFVHEMIEFWTDFVSETMKPILEKVRLDYVLIQEDMAYKGHSMISPQMTREFLVPAYERWISQLKQARCSVIAVDSDGYIAELIPI